MLSKLKFKYICYLFVLIATVLFCLQIVLNLFIAGYIESSLVPKAAEKYGIDNVMVEIRRIGFFGVDIGPLLIGTREDPALLVSSVQVDYNPAGLVIRHIRKVVLSGIELNCKYKDNRLLIPGLDLNRLLAAGEPEKVKEPALSEVSLPVSIGSLEVKNAVINFRWNGKPFRIPFELEFVPADKDMTSINCIVSIFPRDQKITSKVDIHLNNNKIAINLDAESVCLESFADLITQIPGLILSGRADLNGKADIQLMPFLISSVTAICEIENGKIGYQDIILQNSWDKEKENFPLQIKLTGSGGTEWEISGSSFSFVSPLPIEVSGFHFISKIQMAPFESSGSYSISIDRTPQNLKVPVKVLKPIPVKGSFSATYSNEGRWEFKLTNKDPDAGQAVSRLDTDTLSIASKMPRLDVSGNGTGPDGTAEFSVIIPDMNINMKPGNIKIPVITLSGKADFSQTGDNGSNMLFNGALQLSVSSIAASQYQSKIMWIRANLPFAWPCEFPGKKGNFSIGPLMWKNMNMGTVSGTLQQKDMSISLKGEYTGKLITGLKADFSGKAGLLSSSGFETDIRFQLLHKGTTADIDIGQFLPEAQGTVVNGELEISGDFTVNNDGIKSPLTLRLNNGKLKMEEKKISVEGIHVSLSIPDLLEMRSDPKQQILFEKASSGNITVSDGKIEFQIESARTFFIENSGFKWCNGSVYTQAMRISSGINDYDLILYCDRLNLAEILDQFGAAKAEGEGTVSGRIPVSYKNSKISFNDGFLFSAPGDGGRIYLTGTEILTAGIPENTPQFAQIELAREALKNYQYDWAKLQLTTEEEDLLLKMEFDGKPVKPLPFVYNKKIGGFVRVEAGSPGSHFQGIGLDVNFRLPLNKIIQYKDVINMIQ